MGHALPLGANTLQTAALQLLVVLVFVTRDVLFLQWCMLTRLRQPVVKRISVLMPVLRGCSGIRDDVRRFIGDRRPLDVGAAHTSTGIRLTSKWVAVPHGNLYWIGITDRSDRHCAGGHW